MRLLPFFFVTAITLSAAAADMVTLQGVAQETKDGIYVDGVLISDSAFAKGQHLSQFVGRKVKVTGVVREVKEEDPNKGKDPAKDPIVQARVGSWRIMNKVESIVVIP